jgi:hypothetical protein
MHRPEQPSEALSFFKSQWRTARKGYGAVTSTLNQEKGSLAQLLEAESQARVLLSKVFDGPWGSRYLDLLVTESQLVVQGEERGAPSIEESFYTTELLIRKEKEIIELLTDNVSGVIRVGSLAWSKYYWLYAPHKEQRCSDLDLEVVCTQEEIVNLLDHPYFSQLPGFTETITRFLEHYEAGQTDFVTYRLDFDGFPVSMHFVPMNTFKKVCATDFDNLSEKQTLREFRMNPRSSGYTYKQRSFDGSTHLFEADVEKLSEGLNINVPLAFCDTDGNFVMGYPPDKYLSGQVMYDPASDISMGISEMTNSVRARLERDRQQNNGEDLSLSKAFCRSHRMNPILKAEIDQNFEAVTV